MKAVDVPAADLFLDVLAATLRLPPEDVAAAVARPEAARALARLAEIQASASFPLDLIKQAWLDRDWAVIGYPSYAAWCRGALGPAHVPKSRDSATQSVYFIQAVTGGAVKIGVATDVHRRLGDLQTGSPLRLRVIAVISGAGYFREAELHARFVSSHSHGEWFHPTADLMAFIAEHGRPADDDESTDDGDVR